ncbi:prolactin receptor a isoform X2 [Mugil cephalus]|uniref:prolactin receptor a isoform X2 n=1 Tax=Mugil cephalus TaxID=48193 RepID=UPI001FB7F36E|nr:prolactin receptor a isoform X2 [Mugil cephalus]
MMKKVGEAVPLLLLLFFMQHRGGTCYSLPGKPTQIKCRSPEKETFTCWWEPGSDGGLPTTYALYYRKENSEVVHECSDYRTGGKNSCFFNKNNTSIWVNYNITVVATNALGSTFSDPMDVDVVYIVEPYPPENVTVAVMGNKRWPFLRVSWEPPRMADTASGWITLIYELRVKLEGEHEWEVHRAGQQKMFNIFSLSGGTYFIQVRCRPDHGFWSEWTSTSTIEVPDFFNRETSVWILITIFIVFIFVVLIWLIFMNSHSLKHYILPPVPGPKIKGFENQLLKTGKCDETFSALVGSDYPPTSMSSYEDLLVEYLEVYVPSEQELMLEETKDMHDGCLKSESSASDSDSGRGSCDSHTLLMDKCGEAKEADLQTEQEGRQVEAEAQRHQAAWEALTYAHEDMVSPDMSGGRVKTWPSVFSPLPQYSSKPLNPLGSLETAKQHCLSDSQLPADCLSSYLDQPVDDVSQVLGSSYSKFCLSNKEPHLLHPAEARRHLQAHSDVNISVVGRKEAPASLKPPPPQPTEYVEVQQVKDEDIVLLHPVSSSHGKFYSNEGEDYSKVKGVDKDKVLLLQREVVEEDMCLCESQETNGATESCYATSIISAAQKPTACINPTLPVQALNGYVDSSTMFTLSTY